MLKLTWSTTVTWSSGSNNRCGIIHREIVPAFNVSTLSKKGLNTNQLGLLLSLRNTPRNKSVCKSLDPNAAFVGDYPWGTLLQGCVLGVVVTLILPFGRIKWGPLQAFKDRVNKVINTAESVAETDETVAKKVENIAEDIANKLPDDGQLKEIVTSVEKFANVTAKDAHFVDSFLLKVEKLEEKVGSLYEPGAQLEKLKEQTENDVDEPKIFEK